MTSIKIKEISFGDKKFRKIKNMNIPISPRITIIAGHNGIGKSTVLALLAHPSGLTSKKYISYFGKTYQANFNQIIHIDHQRDFLDKKGPPKMLSEPNVVYEINGSEQMAKACRLGPRGKVEARMIARSVKPSTKNFISQDGTVEIGPAQKVPVPTIYLGMTRVLPIGEAEQGRASSTTIPMYIDDAKLVADFMNAVIAGSNSSAERITIQKIKDTGKVSGQPRHEFDPRCVSVGQDSLGSIAFALASFAKLKREWDGYPGGILIIDEIDTGLHPHAIGALVSELKSRARKLNLQIIATTHSPKLIQAVHPESEPQNPKPIDSVVYIRDTANPKKVENHTLKRILDDMDLVPPGLIVPPPLIVKVYFEDDEAASVFSAIANDGFIMELNEEFGIDIRPMPMGLGCGNLANLSKHDPYFLTVVIVLDADASVDKENPDFENVALLPGDMYAADLTGAENKDVISRPLSPERNLLQYILSIINNPEAHESTLDRLDKIDVTTDHLRNQLIDGVTTVLSKREQTKEWWKSKWDVINAWGLLGEWVVDRPEEAHRFRTEFRDAVVKVVQRISKSAGQA